MITLENLQQQAKYIGSISFGDCFYTHSYELWQKGLYFYEREYFYSGDDEGYDNVKKLTLKQAIQMRMNEEFYAV